MPDMSGRSTPANKTIAELRVWGKWDSERAAGHTTAGNCLAYRAVDQADGQPAGRRTANQANGRTSERADGRPTAGRANGQSGGQRGTAGPANG